MGSYSEAERVPLTKARSGLSHLVAKVCYGDERVIITKSGREMAALVPIENLEHLENLKALQLVEEARKEKRIAEEEGFVDAESI